MAMPQTIQMANLGMADSLILMVMALVVFGPRRLPQIGRQIGKLMYEFRKASNDFKFQMEEELRVAEDADRRKKEEERVQALALAAPKSIEAAPVSTDRPYTSESMIAPPALLPAGQSEEMLPRIMPPATGEPVAAERPNRYYTPPEPASEAQPQEDKASQETEDFIARAGIDADAGTAGTHNLLLPFDDDAELPADHAEAGQSAHHA